MLSTANVDPNLDNIPTSHYKRWKLILELHNHFWKRWKNEYLQTLQLRSKWSTGQKNLTVDTLVLIREPTPPLCWKLGRITEVHPGQDGVVRVATVKTTTGLLKRPTIKLCPLPICWMPDAFKGGSMFTHTVAKITTTHTTALPSTIRLSYFIFIFIVIKIMIISMPFSQLYKYYF